MLRSIRSFLSLLPQTLQIPGFAMSKQASMMATKHLTQFENSILHLEHGAYWVGPRLKTFDTGFNSILPSTLIHCTRERSATEQSLKKTFGLFAQEDDVFSDDFRSAVIVPASEGEVLTDDGRAYVERHGQVVTVQQEHLVGLREGPYFLSSKGIHEAWRIFEDKTDSFLLPIVPHTRRNGSFKPFDGSGVYGPSLGVPVPSRLYSETSKEKPLSGLRLAVKDIYDVAGIRTAASNKAYMEFFGPATSSAPSVQRLIDLGATVVGKTKSTSFADREYPPSDWIDFHCPFNPRGDGYLVPQGSSSGSAASVAAYPWLDVALGTDTSASLRAPASAQGLFGLRPSHGSIPMSGIVPLVPRFDTAGLLVRNISLLNKIVRVWYNPQQEHAATKYPSKILYSPKWEDNGSNEKLPEVAKIFESFVQKLEDFLSTTRTSIDVAEEWTKEDPLRSGKGFKQDLLNTYERIHGPASYEFQSAWTKEYVAKHGKAPYLPPAIKNRWPYVKEISKEMNQEAHHQADTYRDWFTKKYLHPDRETASNAIMVHRWTFGITYRDTLKETPNAKRDYGFSTEFGPSYAELPELVIPIGQFEYHSNVSGTIEYAPVGASLIGAKGSEYMLLSLAEEFVRFAGLRTEVLTGRTAFPAKEHFLGKDWKL